MVQLSFYPIADSYLVVGLAAAVLLGLLAILPAREKAAGPRRAVLVALRVAVIALLILAMLRPTLVYTETRKQSATAVVLVDQTRSMSVPDGGGGKTRYEVAQRALAEAAPQLRRLSDDFEVKAYGFDSQLRPLEVDRGLPRLSPTPEGTETALGAALEDVLRREAAKRLLGVIVLSDGAQRAYAPLDVPPQVAAARLRQLGTPLFAVPIGQGRQGKDVAVTDLLVSPQVFVKNELEVTGQLRVDGYANQKLPMRLLVESAPGQVETADQQTASASGDDQVVPFRFTYVPKVPGEYKLTVEVAPQPGERLVTNNRMSNFVNVLKGGLNLLYLEGTPRPEAKWVRRSLDASPDIQVDFKRFDPLRRETRPPDLAERFQPGKYDAYLIGDVDSSAFTPAELTELAQTVSQGAGLMMMGGLHTFGPGGYATTPLAPVLPVTMSRLERQPLDGQIRTDLHVPGPLRMLPTALGQRHFTMLLAPTPEASLAVWEKLWPLDGANRFAGLAPGAVVLAATGQNPLLVAHTFGTGRVVAFAADSTWRWYLHGAQPAHKRFWRQMILWLARKDQAMEGNVWIKLQQRRLAPRQRADFSIEARAPNGDPVTDWSAEATVVAPDGTRRPVQLIRQENQFLGSFRETQAPGDYAVEVAATSKGTPLGSARARFLIYPQDLELDNSAADPSLLENLAAMTGGQRLAPEQLPTLIERLSASGAELLVQQETKTTFWDRWPFFLAFVTILGLQWYLRKRWGLV